MGKVIFYISTETWVSYIETNDFFFNNLNGSSNDFECNLFQLKDELLNELDFLIKI